MRSIDLTRVASGIDSMERDCLIDLADGSHFDSHLHLFPDDANDVLDNSRRC